MAKLFAKILKRWRGKMRQKNAADVLGVPLKTYQNWEQGVNAPDKWREPELKTKMGL